MFKLNITHKNTYSEMGQPNPMRWRLMFHEENTLSSQSGLIACKDFFNDVVAWKHIKQAFNIYRFDNQVNFNEEGMYLLLTKIADETRFVKSIENAINPQLMEDLGVEITCYQQGKGQVVILLPHELWKSTYHISVVSMMIRLCNYDVSYTCWEDFFKEDMPINTIENAFSTEAKKFVKAYGFYLPAKFQGYWYFARNGFTSKSNKDIIPTIIHNNGATSWTEAMSAA